MPLLRSRNHGAAKLFASCTTPVSDGMEVITLRQTERLPQEPIQLLLSERTHICSVCVANKHCELQELANKLGVDHVIFESEWTRDNVDSTHDFLVIDRTAASSARDAFASATKSKASTPRPQTRGKDAQVIVDLDENWSESTVLHFLQKMRKSLPRRSNIHRG